MPLRRDGNVKVQGPFADICAGSGLPPAASPLSPLLPCAPLSTPSNVLTPPSSNCVNTETEPLNPGCVGIKLLRKVPWPVREQLARKLAEILDLVVSTNCRESWKRLFLFCHNCLHMHAPPRRATGETWPLTSNQQSVMRTRKADPSAGTTRRLIST